MSEIDLYELGVKLLGDEPTQGEVDATAIRLGTLQGVINQVNAALAQSRGPAQGGATAAGGADPGPRAAARVALHKPGLGSPMGGMWQQAAAGVAARPLRPEAASSPDLTSAAGRPIIHAAHVPSRNVPAPVPVVQDVASGTPLPERGRARAKRHADRVTAAELPSLLAKATPDRLRDEHALPAALIRANDDRRYKRPLAGIPARAEAHAALWHRTASSLRNVASFAPSGAGALMNQDDKTQNHLVRPAAMTGVAGMGWDGETPVGAAIEGTWRRIQRPGGKAAATVGDIAYSGAAGGGAADGSTVIGAIVAATLAVATEQLAVREQPPGRDSSQLGGVPVPGAMPDRPLYTRIVTDQSPIPTMVTNHDALTSATVTMLAQHQASMPTAPTGLNNHLVPPAPGVPAPGSYHP